MPLSTPSFAPSFMVPEHYNNAQGHVTTRNNILFWAMQAYVVLSIFQVFKSGYPQPADVMIVFAIGLALIGVAFRSGMKLTRMVAYSALFALYTFLVNVINYYHIRDTEFLLSSLYYIFNVSVFLFFVFLVNQSPERFRSAAYKAIVISIVIEFIYAITISWDSIRTLGTFNNPNQYSYWVILTFCLLICVRYPDKFRKFDYILISMLTMMVMMGLSKGAMLSHALIIVGLLCTTMVHRFFRYSALFLALCGTIFLLLDPSRLADILLSVDQFDKISERFLSIGQQSDDSIEARGYYRLFENPEYLLLGAGEGGYTRFNTPYQLHSGLATILFSYGFFGAGLLGFLILHIYQKLPLIFWVMMAAIMFYGLTHHNIRFTHFWVFLAMSYAASAYIQQRAHQSVRIT